MGIRRWEMALVLGLIPAALAVEAATNQVAMSDIRFSDFAGFEDKWRLVTVRFRRDSGELRFTYANELAWRALKEGGAEFPDGSVLAKIGRMSEEDPAFTSSAVPSGAKRFQFMVRNKRKYATTDGWGYALFDASGKVMAEDPPAVARACAACHSLVPERGFVFSQIMDRATKGQLRPSTAKLTFAAVNSSALPAALQGMLPEGVTKVESLQGPLRERAFPGTLDEVTPLLADRVVTSGQPAALVSTDGRYFVMVLVDQLNRQCKGSGEVAMLVIRSGPSLPSSDLRRSFCHIRK